MARPMLLTQSGFNFARCVFRHLASSSSSGGPKDPSSKDVLGADLLDAVNAVASDLHKDNSEAKKTTRNTLISKLVAHEKHSFEEATASQASEMLEDKAIHSLLNDVASDNKPQTTTSSRFVAAQNRQDRKGLVLLRKEMFYQAVQSGYKTDEARRISEKAVEEAQRRVVMQRKAQLEGSQLDSSKVEEEGFEREEKERKLYDFAYQMAEKMLFHDDVRERGGSAKRIVRADPNLPSLLKTDKSLGVWKSVTGAQEDRLTFWKDWDLRAARIVNQSLGPENSFQEQKEWTSQGKQWPYPIDNEYNIGAEENVSFVDHVFLERHLPSLGIPKSGPIAHFMQLVCVGLSKNPYMPVTKKVSHLRWFADYFNKEKQELVHRLHEEEQIAAQNA